jgi:maleate cis-trans isomerase
MGALSISQPVLLTPFDAPLNERLAAFLTERGIEPVLPTTSFSSIEAAAAASPDKVFALAKRELAVASGADGIYFQGGRLDPMPVLERMERELHTTVIASNPAMLWHILTKLGLRFHIEGGGRLLYEWPNTS